MVGWAEACVSQAAIPKASSRSVNPVVHERSSRLSRFEGSSNANSDCQRATSAITEPIERVAKLLERLHDESSRLVVAQGHQLLHSLFNNLDYTTLSVKRAARARAGGGGQP